MIGITKAKIQTGHTEKVELVDRHLNSWGISLARDLEYSIFTEETIEGFKVLNVGILIQLNQEIAEFPDRLSVTAPLQLRMDYFNLTKPFEEMKSSEQKRKEELEKQKQDFIDGELKDYADWVMKNKVSVSVPK